MFSIFFLSLYLLSTTQMCELCKLPVLIQHYKEHRALNRGVTFLYFLDMHYMHGSPHDADYARDMQLPFKTCAGTPLALMLYVPPVSENFTVVKMLHRTKKLKLYSASPDYSFNYMSSVWQPPRAC